MSKQPTTSELEILNILWEKESATVREVFEVISATKPITYTTVLKLMQIMTDKDLVERDEQGKAHLYRAKIAQAETQKGMVSELLEKVFRGSAMELMQHILESKKTSPADM
ncbi:MAG TPA: BlaI/MecI/CopY family transcriptional regulator, partial [Pyrinomonadaceae bacterium]|nr:BlaI/MecI/CopY family transcriptional regulator [Pyrinomonadaceae bacterium]